MSGYDLYRNGTSVGTTSATSRTFSGLTCGTSYTLGVDAFDAVGNKSTASTITASTAACPDTQAPTAPTGLLVTGSTATSISISWSASFDNVAVAGYDAYLGSTLAGTTTTFTIYTFSGLTCGTSYTVAVDAFDPSGNKSTQDVGYDLDGSLCRHDEAFDPDGTDRDWLYSHVDLAVVERVNGQRRSRRVRAVPERKPGWQLELDQLLVHGPGLWHVVHARRDGLRCGRK